MKKVRFELTTQHIALIRNMVIRFDEGCETGAPAVCPKRPYGNSDVANDVAVIIGLEPIETDDGEQHWPKGTHDKCMALHRETATALQVCVSAQSFRPGIYTARKYFNDWKPESHD